MASSRTPSISSGSVNRTARTVARPSVSRLMVAGATGGGGPSIEMSPGTVIVSLIVNGFCKQVLQELPMEFAVEAQKLLEISLEGSVG